MFCKSSVIQAHDKIIHCFLTILEGGRKIKEEDQGGRRRDEGGRTKEEGE
jgi:hypothetical protein